VNFGFEIIQVSTGKRSTIYTIKIDGEELSELDKFLTNPEVNKEESKVPLRRITSDLIEEIPNRGAREYYFEYESSSTNAVCKLKHTQLRLYCLRFGKLMVIAGNGGVKPSNVRKTQDSKELQEIVNKLIYIEQRILEAQKNGNFQILDNTGEISQNSKTSFDPI
jgi:hypothetical protein